jgi:peptidoglycan/xylan/chitin deacetylase (PgdA/CDA1 family)
VAVLFFVLAAVGFSRASNAEEEAEALRDDVAAAESLSDELRAEGEALRDRADGLEDEVAAAGRRAAEAEEAARLQWEPLIAENERLAAENRFLRKAVVVSSAAGDVARVGLTFDGDPTPGALASTLDTLAAAGVQATFFPSGSAMEANPDGWVRAVAEGHELGNATYDRVPIDRADPEAALESIKGWERAARLVAGSDFRATWFRPPLLGGFEDRVGTREVRNLIARRGLITALWSVETYYALFASGGPQEAGPDPDASDVAAYVTGEAGGGSIILLQFGSLDIDAVPDILVGLRGKGLEPGTLTQLFDAQERMYDGDLASPDGA